MTPCSKVRAGKARQNNRMCGIAGILRWEGPPPAEAEIEAMKQAVAHRGPDGSGVYLRDGVALGHQRLSIIDVGGGRQPMSNEDGTVWITYNGELYNFRELRRTLEHRGHRFATHSDTEVIVHAYEEWGTAAVERFRGMFAFAIADFRNRRLFLARDQFGIKPLFYRRGSGYVAFGSELSVIRAVHDQSPVGCREAINDFLQYRYIPGPRTIYAGVDQLPPAHHMTIGFDGAAAAPVRYWNLTFEPAPDVDDGVWLERIEAVIDESVRAHLVSDVPFGVFLSGGIDSTLIARQMSLALGRSVTAFSIGFDEEEFSELPFAEKAARVLGIDLQTHVVTADVAHLLPQLVRHYGQPFADTSMIPTWYLAQLARAHVPMVLSGDGGDESFAGYQRYQAWANDGFCGELARLMRSPRSLFWRLPRLRARWTAAPDRWLDQWQDHAGLMPAELRRTLWQPDYRSLVVGINPAFARAAERAPKRERVAYAQFMDFQTYLPDDILVKVDIAAMYHGLEVRPPLVDVQVVELASQLPARLRFRNRGARTTLKWSLKELLRREFGHAFVHRRKMGFGIPENKWLKRGTQARQLFDDLCQSDGAPVHEWLCPGTIRQLANQLDAGKNTGAYLWSILVLALWREQNRDVCFG